MGHIDEILVGKAGIGKSELGRNVDYRGGAGFPSAAVQSSVDSVGGVIKTTILIDLAQGAGSKSANKAIGTDGSTTDGAYIYELSKDINGVPFGVRFSCIEVPAGGDPDINLSCSATGTTAYDETLSSGTVLLNNGDLTLGESAYTAIGASGLISGDAIAKQFIYLEAGAATTAAYTAGKIIIEFFGAKV